MAIRSIRDDLQAARTAALAGDTQTTIQVIDRLLSELSPDRFVTPVQAAELLGVRSVNTVRLWVRTGYLASQWIDGRYLIPLPAIEALQDAEVVRAIRAADALHDDSTPPSPIAPLTDDDLLDLGRSRPGTLPWQRDQRPTK